MSEPMLLSPPTSPPISTLYEQDFCLWTQTMADALRSGEWSQLDIENLVEEVESLGRSDRRELQSRLTVLLMHLLKWQFQPELQCGSWRGTLAEQRIRIRKLLKESPSLRSVLDDSIDECYDDAKIKASAETGLPSDRFPVSCAYGIEDLLNLEFFPN